MLGLKGSRRSRHFPGQKDYVSMHHPSRFTKLILAIATAISLVASVAVVPAASASVASTSISAKKKVLTTEQKKAKAKLDAANKALAAKTKALAAAVKAQEKATKALAKAQAAQVKAQKSANALQAKSKKSATKKNKAAAKKAKAALTAANKKVATAQATYDRTFSVVARQTVVRDTTQAVVIRSDAQLAWLVNDISTLNCGAGTNVTTPSGAVEHVWECGIVYKHEDGDTTHVKTTTNQLVEVRNIGLQTPERAKGANPAQCGAEQAYQNFMNLMPEQTTIVQLRSIVNGSNTWGGNSRPTRSVYKLNNATGAFDIDVQAEQIKAGWSLWWPLAEEWAHNKEYLDLMNTAKTQGVGIWNPNLCGQATGGVPAMWFNDNAPTIEGNTEPAFGEYVVLQNQSGTAMDLTNWSLRDNSLNFFWSSENSWMQSLNKFGSMVLQPGEHRIIYLDNPAGYSLSSTEYEYFNWTRNTPGAQLTNGSVTATYANGDGVYLQDPLGNIRNSMTNPCTSAAMCTTPQWVTDIISSSRAGQIIPIPVALNKVRDTSKDFYNPVVSLTAGATAVATKAALTSAGFTAADGTPIDSALAAGIALVVSDTESGTNIAGLRRGIADLAGTTRTTLYVQATSGFNTVPTLTGLTEADARAAIVAAGFVIGTVGQTTLDAASEVSSQVQSGRIAVGSAVSFTVNTNTPPA
jgi:endonuclease YncB( thermonuclease family)